MLNRRMLLWLLPAAGVAAVPNGRLVVCGWDELFILDIGKTPPVKIWTWKAANRPELPPEMRRKLRTIDECKPIDAGKRILITASSDAVAVVERATGKAVFHATVVNAHSAELLPGGRVAAAASHRLDAEGDRIVLYDLDKSERPLFHTELYSGHGLVWDDARKLLWALSGPELRAYKLSAWESAAPKLEKTESYKLPDGNGHDLYAVAGTAMLSLSTGQRCWLFDRDGRRLLPHPSLAGRDKVKCISADPATGRTVWVQAEGSNWWTDKLRFLNPEAVLQLPGERIYKARWLPR